MAPNHESNSASEFQTINERLAKIEKYLWPPLNRAENRRDPLIRRLSGPWRWASGSRPCPTGLMNSTAAPQRSKR